MIDDLTREITVLAGQKKPETLDLCAECSLRICFSNEACALSAEDSCDFFTY